MVRYLNSMYKVLNSNFIAIDVSKKKVSLKLFTV